MRKEWLGKWRVGCVVVLGVALAGTGAVQGEEVAKPAPAKVYDEQANGAEQIAVALASAKRENRRVLIQWGWNWCGWCLALHHLYESNAEISKELSYEYETVFVDAGSDRKNVALAKAYGALVDHEGYPYLTILDADGKALANQETSSLEVKNAEGNSVGEAAGHDPVKVMAFLKTHVAPPLNADEVVATGLAEAKQSGRMVFLHFGAPWCGWCRRLDAWMVQPANEGILTKDFVMVKVDTARMTGGAEVAKKWGVAGGIPWFAFVDGDGKVIVTSGDEKTNIGYPGSEEEISRFREMLQKGAKRMTAEDVQALVGSLEAEAKKLGR